MKSIFLVCEELPISVYLKCYFELSAYSPVKLDVDQKMYKVAVKREHNASKSPQKIQTLKMPRSYRDLCNHKTCAKDHNVFSNSLCLVTTPLISKFLIVCINDCN